VSRPSRRDQVVVLRGVPWEQYDALAAAREESARPRMAYLDGLLEIMSVGPKHEFDKKLIARLLEAHAEERDVALNGFGQTTYRDEEKGGGLEPDECYCVGDSKPVPDLCIEVFYTSGGIDKLEIYRRIEVPEVWFWAKGAFWVYRFADARYEKVERSLWLPDLDLVEIARIVRETDHAHQTEAVRAYRRALRSRPATRPVARLSLVERDITPVSPVSPTSAPSSPRAPRGTRSGKAR
jgi:Uma2 family endonuclease